MEQSIQILDLKRMFLGELPWTFVFEIAIRTTIMYVYALMLVRLMGKRGMRQLSPFDFAIVIALGSAVGDPMFYPEVPLLHGMVVLATIVMLERGLANFVHRSEAVESFVEGAPRRLVINGRLDQEGMQREALSREELFATLRVAGAQQLGQVRRAYIEQSGQISTFLYTPKEAKPGLPLIPPWDLARPASFPSGTKAPREDDYACSVCGETIQRRRGEELPLCPRCEGAAWMMATKDPIEDEEAVRD